MAAPWARAAPPSETPCPRCTPPSTGRHGAFAQRPVRFREQAVVAETSVLCRDAALLQTPIADASLGWSMDDTLVNLRVLGYVHPGIHFQHVSLAAIHKAGLVCGAYGVSLGLLGSWLSRFWLNRSRDKQKEDKRWVLGVDVSDSVYLDRPLVRKAAEFAAEAHAGSYRKSGQPYVMHCIETAVITEQLMKLHIFDSDHIGLRRAEAAIVTALLHDVIDDTTRTRDDIEALFGAQIAKNVQSVAQLSRNNQLLRRRHRKLLGSGQGLQAAAEVEAMKAMIIQMTDEPLVIIVKIADRLHNMRTVWALSPEKAVYLAQETMEVWCPLCEYLGLGAIKSELEDICFAILQTDSFECMRRQLDILIYSPDKLDSTVRCGANIKAPNPEEFNRSPSVDWILANGTLAASTVTSPGAPTTSAASRAAFTSTSAETPSPAGSPTRTADRSSSPAHSGGGPGASAHAARAAPNTARLAHAAEPGSVGRPSTSAAAEHAPLASVDEPCALGASAVTPTPPTSGVTASHNHTRATHSPQADALASHPLAAAASTLSAADEAALARASPLAGTRQTDAGAAATRDLSTSSEAAALAREASPSSSAATHLPAAATRSAHPAAEPCRASAAPGAAPAASAALQSAGAASHKGAHRPSGAALQREFAAGGADARGNLSSAPDADSSAPDAHSSTESSDAVLSGSMDDNGTCAGGGCTYEYVGPSLEVPNLTARQNRLAAAIGEVVPFTASNFVSMHTEHTPSGTSPAMGFLKDAASQLMHEINIDGGGAGLNIQIQGRVKSLYSTYRKMASKNLPLSCIYDTLALRVIVSDGGDLSSASAIAACYRIRPIVSRKWRPVPREFDDYIAHPKGSGYQSLHTAVHGPSGIPMEVQIRTSSMQYAAEYGAASHWAYKDMMRATAAAAPAPAPPAADAAAAHSAANSTARSSPAAAGAAAAAASAAASPAPASSGDASAGAAAAYGERLRVGQPVRCIVDGVFTDGVILGVDTEQRAVLAATTVGRRWPRGDAGPLDPLPAAEYQAMAARVAKRGWHAVGQGDTVLQLHAFYESADGEHCLVDHYGRKSRYSVLETVEPAPDAVPDAVPDAAPAESSEAEPAASADASGALGGRGAGSDRRAAPAAPAAELRVSGADAGAAAGVFGTGEEPAWAVECRKIESAGVGGSRGSASADSGSAAARAMRIGRWEEFQPGLAARADSGASRGADPVQGIDSERVVRLRALLEWGNEVRGLDQMPASKRELYNISNADQLIAVQQTFAQERCEQAATDADAAVSASVLDRAPVPVLLYPGDIEYVPAGSTAGDVVRSHGWFEFGDNGGGSSEAVTASGERLVNVNNQLVPESTALQPGDLVVLSETLLDL